MSICPVCNGQKGSTGYACPGFRPVLIPCRACGATGEVTDQHLANLATWRVQGDALRKARIEQRERQADAATRFGIDVARYSRIEFGLEPLP